MGSRENLRAGLIAAIVAAAGVLLSGPIGMIAVLIIQPQPPWVGAETFVANYHFVQTAPFFLGFLLVGGFVALHAIIHVLAEPELRRWTLPSLAFATIFGALIVLNYIIQTTFVPGLVAAYHPGLAPIVEMFTMSNPRSLGWAIEMYGYGVLGVASIFAAPFFGGTRTEHAASVLLVLNGIVSIATALVTSVDPDWVFSAAGLAGYAIWNALVFAMLIVIAAAFRARMRAAV